MLMTLRFEPSRFFLKGKVLKCLTHRILPHIHHRPAKISKITKPNMVDINYTFQITISTMHQTQFYFRYEEIF